MANNTWRIRNPSHCPPEPGPENLDRQLEHVQLFLSSCESLLIHLIIIVLHIEHINIDLIPFPNGIFLDSRTIWTNMFASTSSTDLAIETSAFGISCQCYSCRHHAVGKL